MTRLGSGRLEDKKNRRISVALFAATLASLYLTYGFQWTSGNPLTDPQVALDAAYYSLALITILLAHEMAHYVTARRHGFQLTLPFFIPFPLGFGTLGAIIGLRSPPRSRTALLEMGAAGPLAGAVVAFVMLALGLRHTGPDVALEPGGHYLIFNDCLAVELLGTLVNGAPPGRYAELHPVALAGWIGCLLTAMNLLPVGQLDGGHVMGALKTRWALNISRVAVGLLLVAGLAWPAWTVWGSLLLWRGVWRNLPVPGKPQLTARARWVAVAALVVFALTWMPKPMELEQAPLAEEAAPAEAP